MAYLFYMLKLKVWDYFASLVVFFVLTFLILISTQSIPFQFYIVFLYIPLVVISVLVNFFFAVSRFNIPDFRVKMNMGLLILVLVVFTFLAFFRLQSGYTYGGNSGYLAASEYNWIQSFFISDKAKYNQGAWIIRDYVFGVFSFYLVLVFLFQFFAFGDIVKRGRN